MLGLNYVAFNRFGMWAAKCLMEYVCISTKRHKISLDDFVLLQWIWPHIAVQHSFKNPQPILRGSSLPIRWNAMLNCRNPSYLHCLHYESSQNACMFDLPNPKRCLNNIRIWPVRKILSMSDVNVHIYGPVEGIDMSLDLLFYHMKDWFAICWIPSHAEVNDYSIIGNFLWAKFSVSSFVTSSVAWGLELISSSVADCTFWNGDEQSLFGSTGIQQRMSAIIWCRTYKLPRPPFQNLFSSPGSNILHCQIPFYTLILDAPTRSHSQE